MDGEQDTTAVKEKPRRAAKKEQLLGTETCKVRYKDVELPGDLGWITLRSLNDAEYTDIQQAAIKKDGSIDKPMAATMSARLQVACVLDFETKQPMYSIQDVREIRKRDLALSNFMNEAINEHLGLKDEETLKKE